MIIPGVSHAGNMFLERETQLDRNWGRSYETAKYLQILNPDAEKNRCPVAGIEGMVGQRIMEGYIKGETKKKSSSNEMGILRFK